MTHHIQGPEESKESNETQAKGQQKLSPKKRTLSALITQFIRKIMNLADQACFGNKAVNFEAVKQGLVIGSQAAVAANTVAQSENFDHLNQLAYETAQSLTPKQEENLSRLSNKQLRNIKVFLKNHQHDVKELIPVISSIRRDLSKDIQKESTPKLDEFKEGASGFGEGVHR